MGHVRRHGGESGDDAYDDHCCTTLCTTGFPKFPPNQNFYQPTMDPGSSIVLFTPIHTHVTLIHPLERSTSSRARSGATARHVQTHC